MAALSKVPSMMIDLVVDDDVDSMIEAHHAAGKYIVVVILRNICDPPQGTKHNANAQKNF